MAPAQSSPPYWLFVALGTAALVWAYKADFQVDSPVPVQDVSLEVLEQETQQFSFIAIVGKDDTYHYFVAPGGHRYRVAGITSESLDGLLDIARNMNGIPVFVVIRNGVIASPDIEHLDDLTAIQELATHAENWSVPQTHPVPGDIEWTWMCHHQNCTWMQPGEADQHAAAKNVPVHEHADKVILVPMLPPTQPKWMIGPELSDVPNVTVSIKALQGEWRAASHGIKYEIAIRSNASGRASTTIEGRTISSDGTWSAPNSSHIQFLSNDDYQMYSVRYLSADVMVVLEYDDEFPRVFRRVAGE